MLHQKRLANAKSMRQRHLHHRCHSFDTRCFPFLSPFLFRSRPVRIVFCGYWWQIRAYGTACLTFAKDIIGIIIKTKYLKTHTHAVTHINIWNENQNKIVMTMMLFITFIYYVCVCVQNICFVVFTWWFLFIVYEQFFYCYFFPFVHFAIHGEHSVVRRPLRLSRLLLLSLFVAWCIYCRLRSIAINYPVAAKGQFHITSHDFIVFTIDSPLFVISFFFLFLSPIWHFVFIV